MLSKGTTLGQIARDIEAAYIKADKAEDAAFRASFTKGAAVTFRRNTQSFFGMLAIPARAILKRMASAIPRADR